MASMPLDEAPFLAVSKGEDRLYRWDNRIINRTEIKDATADFPSVTTIIGMLNKPQLPPWAARTVAEFAVENIDTIKRDIQAEEEGNKEKGETVAWLKTEPIRRRDRSGERGSAVHKILELIYADNQPLDKAYNEVVGDIRFHGLKDEGLDDFVRPVVKWFQENVVEIVASEGIVYNTRHLYAGSFDSMVRMRDGRIAIIDYKTSNRVYETTSLQLTAYSMCDKLAIPVPPTSHRYKRHLDENPHLKEEDPPPRLAEMVDLPVSDHGIVAHLPGKQKAKFYYTEFTREHEQCIIGLRRLWDWSRKSKRSTGRGNPPAWSAKIEEISTEGVDLETGS